MNHQHPSHGQTPQGINEPESSHQFTTKEPG
jgi:hypothetical protein